MEHTAYGSHWDDVLRLMHDPVDADTAQAAYERGEQVSVAGGPDPLTAVGTGAPGARDSRRPAAWAIDAALSRGALKVRFYEPAGALEVAHTYQLAAQDRLLLTEKTRYEYLDPTDRSAQWARATEVRVTGEGQARAVTRQLLSDGTESIRMVEQRDQDLSSHWAAVPAFGDWSGVLERDR